MQSLVSEQAHTQHVPRAQFVAHANLSISLIASDEVAWLLQYFAIKLLHFDAEFPLFLK